MKKTSTAPAGWFYLEAYVYPEAVAEEALLLNTLDKQLIRLTAPSLVKLIARLSRPEQCGVVKISARMASTSLFQTFLHEIRTKFMGDFLDLARYPTKPVQVVPLHAVMHDVRKKQFGNGESYFSYLHELTIHVDTRCEQNCLDCFSFARQSGGCTPFSSSNRIMDVLQHQLPHLAYMPHLCGIHIVATHCFETERGERLCDLLHDYREICQLTIHALNLPSVGSIARKFFDSRIRVLADVDTPLPPFGDEALAYTWIFFVRSVGEYQRIREQLRVHPQGLSSYRFLPIYTGHNDDFFRENVYVDPDELLQLDHDMQEIHRNGLLNSYFFGRLTLTPDGMVHTHLDAPPLGNLRTHSWETLIGRACSRKNSAWFRIRGRQACGVCVYKNLCPPLSLYEEVIGQSCLCTRPVKNISAASGE